MSVGWDEMFAILPLEKRKLPVVLPEGKVGFFCVRCDGCAG